MGQDYKASTCEPEHFHQCLVCFKPGKDGQTFEQKGFCSLILVGLFIPSNRHRSERADANTNLILLTYLADL